MMKLVAGMGSIDDYIPYVQAGADEIFCGFCPDIWYKTYGIHAPLNRREVCYYNVQLGSYSELEILQDMINDYRIPVTLTFNALHYHPAQYSMITSIMEECMALGFNSFIIADPALLIFLHEKGIAENMNIHVSGEFGEMNHYLLPMLQDLNCSRLIFHRKMSIDDMNNIIQSDEGCGSQKNFSYEAFFLNEMCHFHGGYCNSLHLDELVPMCREPYTPGLRHENHTRAPLPCSYDSRSSSQDDSEADYLTGASGCGMCALWQLQKIGIDYLKIVGRGAYSEQILQDIQNARRALLILQNSTSQQQYITAVKEQIFPDGCSKQCYYSDYRDMQ